MEQKYGDPSYSHENQHHKDITQKGLLYKADGLPWFDVTGENKTYLTRLPPMRKYFNYLRHLPCLEMTENADIFVCFLMTIEAV